MGYSLATKTNKTLWSWGQNNLYQLNLGDQTYRNSPMQIGNAISWSTPLAGTSGVGGALSSDLKLYMWGENRYGNLGQSNQNGGMIQLSPLPVGVAGKWTAMSIGSNNSVQLELLLKFLV